MYQAEEINNKTYIRNTQTGELVANDNGPIWYAGPIRAGQAIARLNAGKELATVDNRVKGVGDNRSRNWRRRR